MTRTNILVLVILILIPLKTLNTVKLTLNSIFAIDISKFGHDFVENSGYDGLDLFSGDFSI